MYRILNTTGIAVIVIATVLSIAEIVGSTMYFVLVAVGVVGILFSGKFFRIHGKEYLREYRKFEFQVSSSKLLISGDYNFRNFRSVAWRSSSCAVTVQMDKRLERNIALSLVGQHECDSFEVEIEFGLIYIVDSALIPNDKFCRHVADLVEQRLLSPVAVPITFGERAVGVMVEPVAGNGLYLFEPLADGLFCSLNGVV